ncbi:TetR/AcrR family transcriptional regulator [Nocardiopsis halotolerans]|uniref:TetR/AcrR family transcriptional regulator n=1 Tax=Nocardiopsis halotolerans TaxID=124252 RepID=UPI00034559AC|nr:TetR/AcrR family transcriptional regulator [Nocardiopsis halotolerans]
MTGTDSRGAIIDAARELFFERGYNGVTIRDIATAAGVSPALVIKHHHSKAALFNEVGPHDIPLAELDLPRSEMGRALVRKILARRERGVPESWLSAAAHVRESPDPDRSREETRDRLLESVSALIGDTTPERRYAGVVCCQLLGLAEGVRVLGMFPVEEVSRDDLLDLYAPIIQRQIDACARSRPVQPR